MPVILGGGGGIYLHTVFFVTNGRFKSDMNKKE